MRAPIAVNPRLARWSCLPLLLWGASLWGDLVDQGMRQISLHERICMKAFFDHAIQHDQAAHVLYFENKPACLVATILKHKNKPFQEVIHLKGWRAFKRNEHLFPHPRFIFSENVVAFDDAFKVLHVYLVNKQALHKCFHEHYNLFQTHLGPDFSPDHFITQLEQGHSLIQLLNNDEMLLGLVLGFGSESSEAFTLDPPESDTYCGIYLSPPQGCKLAPIIFMGNPHSPEVQQLITSYEHELEAIWRTYQSSKNHLRMVLEQLCTDDLQE